MEKEGDSFFVTVLSNASPEIYSNNTTTKFTNILAKPIILSPDENWKVCLHSITVTNTSNMSVERVQDMRTLRREIDMINETTILPLNLIRTLFSAHDGEYVISTFTNHLLFVECDQISSEFENKGKVLSIVSTHMFSPDEPYTTFEPVTNEYFRLSSHYIPKIDINIKNLEGKNMQTSTAQSTIIVLKFKRMSQDEMDYRVVLVENPEGEEASDFRVSLPKDLLKDGAQNPWEVALTKMTYMPDLVQFTQTEYKAAASFWFSSGFDMADEFEKFVEKTRSDNVSYGTNFGFVIPQSFINDEIFLAYLSNSYTKYYKKETNEWLIVKFGFIPGTKRVQITSNYASIISLSDEILHCLGFELEGMTKCPRWPEENSLLLFHENNATVEGVRTIDSNCNVPNNFLLYVDCVEPSLIGNVYGRYLTNVSVPRKKSNAPIVTYEPKNLEYHRLITGDLSNVNFKFLKSDGNPVLLNNEFNKQRVHLSLLFRKKK